MAMPLASLILSQESPEARLVGGVDIAYNKLLSGALGIFTL